jgi:hypothetical protein
MPKPKIQPNSVARIIQLSSDQGHPPLYGVVFVESVEDNAKTPTARVLFEGFFYTVLLKDLVPVTPEPMIVVTCKRDGRSSWSYPRTIEEALVEMQDPSKVHFESWTTCELTVYEFDFSSDAAEYDKHGVPRRIAQHWTRDR